MPIYRGDGGSGDSTTDAYASQVALDAADAADSANQAASSATAAAASETAAETAETNAETAETNAVASADAAADSAAATINFNTNLVVTASGLSEGASPTVSYNDTTYTMSFGIPVGATGATGATGDGFTGGSYNASTGVVTFTSDDGLGFSTGDLRGADGADSIQLTDLSVTTNAVGTAALSYNNTSGVFSYTPPDLTSFITASSTDTLTNKSGNISQWTNDSGYITSYTETDTLDSVTGRGATTTNAVTVGNLTSTGIDDNATSTAITIDSSQEVGIGVTAPQAPFHARKSIGVATELEVGRFEAYLTGGTIGQQILKILENNLASASGGQYSRFESVFINSVGSTLDAGFEFGGNSAGSYLTINTVGDASFNGAVSATSAVLEGTADSILTLRSTDDGPLYMEFERGTDRHAYMGFGGSNDTFKIWNEESGGLIQFGTNNTEAVRIDENQDTIFRGKVELDNGASFGIGGSQQHTDFLGGSSDGTSDDGTFAFYAGRTFNAGAGVVLYGDDHASNPNQIRFYNNAFVERARFDANGRLGLGTQSPSTELDVRVADGSGINVVGGTGAVGEDAYTFYQSGRARFGYDGAKGAVSISDYNSSGSTTSKAIVFESGGAERMRIAADGAVQFQSAIEEQQYNLTGTAINPNNGTIQYKTLSNNTTFTKSFSNGEFVTLILTPVFNSTATWPTISWVGGSAPVLVNGDANIIELWQVSGTLYGAYAGSA